MSSPAACHGTWHRWRTNGRARGDSAAAASSRELADIRCINFNAGYHVHASSFQGVFSFFREKSELRKHFVLLRRRAVGRPNAETHLARRWLPVRRK